MFVYWSIDTPFNTQVTSTCSTLYNYSVPWYIVAAGLHILELVSVVLYREVNTIAKCFVSFFKDLVYFQTPVFGLATGMWKITILLTLKDKGLTLLQIKADNIEDPLRIWWEPRDTAHAALMRPRWQINSATAANIRTTVYPDAFRLLDNGAPHAGMPMLILRLCDTGIASVAMAMATTEATCIPVGPSILGLLLLSMWNTLIFATAFYI